MPDYTIDQLYQKLERADAAGDSEAAQAIASEIRRLQAMPPKAGAVPKAGAAPRRSDGLLRQSAENLFGQAGANFVDAAQHHALSWLHGGAQLVEHGVNAAANAVLPQGNNVRRFVNRTVAADDAALTQREQAYQARVPDGAAATAGAIVGEVAPWAAATSSLRSAGRLPTVTATGWRGLAQKGGFLTGEGALMGAAQPVTQGDFASEKRKQVASYAVAAPLTGGVLGMLSGASRFATPGGRDLIAGKRLAKLFGDSPEVLAALRRDSGVPGFELTPAQALATPKAVQAERILRNNAATAPAFALRESENNAALRARVAGLAGTDADLAAAKQARKASTDPYYAQLQGQRVDPAPVLRALDALRDSSLGVRPNIKSASNSLRAEIESRLGPDGKIDAGILSGLHENAASHLGPMASGQEKVALGPIKNSIVDAIDTAVPGYRDNLATYARASQPINDMEAARTLLDAIDGTGRDAGGRQVVSLARVRQLLARDDKARFPMSPDAREALETVLEVLQRRSVTNNTVAATGPGTAADVMRGLQSNPWAMRILGHLTSVGGGTMFGVPGYAAGALATEGMTAANNSILRRVGGKAADAKLTADAIEAAQRRRSYLPSNLATLLVPYQVRALPRP